MKNLLPSRFESKQLRAVLCFTVFSLTMSQIHNGAAQERQTKGVSTKSKVNANAKAAVEPVSVQSADVLISNAIAEIEKNELITALSFARKAVVAAPVNYKAHYYMGLILFRMGNFDQADDAAFEAVRFAPEEAQSSVKKLQQAIAWGRTSLVAARDAENAQNEGLNGKAASAWKLAWEAGFQNGEYGFNAAQLYVGRLGQPVAGAKILREVLEKISDQAILDKSGALLKSISPQLDSIANTLFQQARQADGTRQLQFIRDVLDADPNHIGAYELLARYYVKNGDIAQLKEVLKDLSRRNRLDLGVLKHEAFFELLKTNEFSSWLVDLVGDVAVKALSSDVAELERKRDQQLRYEQSMREYAKAMEVYQDRMALFAKYTPCVNATRQAYFACEARIPAPDSGFLGIGGNAEDRAKLHTACVNGYNEKIAQCQASYPSTQPQEPVKPTRPSN